MADVVCTTAMCAEGRASVTQMRSTFDTLVAQYGPGFEKSHFEPTVISIEQQFQANYSVFSEWIPFNPSCCAISDIGKEADQVTRDMLASVNAAQPGPGPSSQPPAVSMQSLMSLGMLALGAWILSSVVSLKRR